MTKQAENLRNLCYRNDEQTIRMTLQMASASVRNEIVSHYGSLDTAVTHLHLGTR